MTLIWTECELMDKLIFSNCKLQMFGREAVKLLDYVECYPEGYRRGVKIAKACADANIDGFPTWIIKGEVNSLHLGK